jgi:hypothetical protein
MGKLEGVAPAPLILDCAGVESLEGTWLGQPRCCQWPPPVGHALPGLLVRMRHVGQRIGFVSRGHRVLALLSRWDAAELNLDVLVISPILQTEFGRV